MCGIIELGQTTSPTRTNKIDQDSFEHIVTCIRILTDPSSSALLGASYRSLCRASFQKLIAVSAPQRPRLFTAPVRVCSCGPCLPPCTPPPATFSRPYALVLLCVAQARRSDASGAHEEKKTESTTQADELISIRQLRGRRAATAVEVELDDEADITKGELLARFAPLALAAADEDDDDVCVSVWT